MFLIITFHCRFFCLLSPLCKMIVTQRDSKKQKSPCFMLLCVCVQYFHLISCKVLFPKLGAGFRIVFISERLVYEIQLIGIKSESIPVIHLSLWVCLLSVWLHWTKCLGNKLDNVVGSNRIGPMGSPTASVITFTPL